MPRHTANGFSNIVNNCSLCKTCECKKESIRVKNQTENTFKNKVIGSQDTQKLQESSTQEEKQKTKISSKNIEQTKQKDQNSFNYAIMQYNVIYGAFSVATLLFSMYFIFSVIEITLYIMCPLALILTYMMYKTI